MTDAIDRIYDGITLEKRQELSAEAHALELVEVCKAAVAGAPHWRHEMQLLLKTIAVGSLPEPQSAFISALHTHHTDVDEDMT
jgi:hypothetical protein